MSVRLLLIRHARVDFASRNFSETPRGRQWDPSLGEEGRAQARTLAARLRLMERPAALVVSPLRRCLETIEPYLASMAPDPPAMRIVEDVGEVFIGAWEGMSFEDIVSGDEELARRFREQEAMFSLAPGGESGSELRARVVTAIEAALGSRERGTVVVVTHGGVINAYLGHVMGIAQDMFFLPENTSLNTVDASGPVRRMRFLNDARHMTDPAVFQPRRAGRP